MATFTVKEEAYVRYQMTTWQGEIEMDGETIAYRYSEDDNGSELYVYTEGDGYNQVDWSGEGNEKYATLMAAIGEWGNPEDFGSVGEEVEIDDTIVEDYI